MVSQRRHGAAGGARPAPEDEEAPGPGGRRRPTIAERIADGELDHEAATEKAREHVLRSLTAAPRSRGQLTEALARKGYPEAVIEPLLERLVEVGLVDDRQLAEMLVRTRHSERGLSRRALAQELRRKGIDEETARGALAQVDDDDEADAARELVSRRLARTRGLDRDVRVRRTVAALARKGYGPSLAFELVRAALDAEALEDETSGSETSGFEAGGEGSGGARYA
ncbi:regulatory protein RecX [Cellulomonas sp. PhB143]|uniref:regulatory protein RecX n=1 Tax=Cellulomonas sp. PhB143 TaxID=2485186 RepID=UPI000FAF96EA|nr:regulatory protein RecX [Cellulomonas sp. PhB143]ROS77171.1 regulatory protein [Cellulomonas sp. PhB143]